MKDEAIFAILLSVMGAKQTCKIITGYLKDVFTAKSASKNSDMKVYASMIKQVYNRDRGRDPVDIPGYKAIDRIDGDDLTLPRVTVFERVDDGPPSDSASREFSDVSGQRVRRPKYVVAIRGTILTSLKDIVDDLMIFFELVCEAKKLYKPLKDLLLKLRDASSPDDVCVVGHSLGAAIALVATVKLATEDDVFNNVHLFNPPNFSVDVLFKKLSKWAVNDLTDLYWRIGEINDEEKSKIRDFRVRGIRKIEDIIRMCGEELAADKYKEAVERRQKLLDNGFCPHLYLNPKDPVCNSYTEHFEGSPRKDNLSCLLIPRAHVHENNFGTGFKHAHSLDQWRLYALVKFKSKTLTIQRP